MATGLVFDGNGDYVEIPDSDDFSYVTTGELSISFWARPDDTTFPIWDGSGGDRYVYMVSKLDVDSGGQREWAFRIYSDDNQVGRANRISFYIFQANNGTGVGSFWQEQVTPGQWIHILVTVKSSVTRLYKNGVLKDTDNFSSLTPSNTHAPVRIGTGQQVGYNTPSYFLGGIDDLRIWNRQLSSTEITSIYNGDDVTSGLVSHYNMDEGSGTTVADSISGHSGTLVSGKWGRDRTTIIAPDTSGLAVHFNGESDYAEIADRTAYSIPTTNYLSVQCWFNPDTDQFVNYEATGYVNFLSKFTYDVVNQAEWEFRIYNLVNNEADTRDNELSFYIFNSIGGLGTSGDAPKSSHNTGNWIHLVGVVDNVARTVKMYRDGVLTETADLTNPLTITPTNTTATTKIGRGASDTAFFKGYIKDVRIWDIALDQTAITNLYSGDRTANRANLVGWWKMDDGSGSVLTDSIGSNDATLHGGTWGSPSTQVTGKSDNIVIKVGG